MKKTLFKAVFVLLFIMPGCSNDNPSDVLVDFIYAVENKKFDDARELCTADTDKLINLQESIANFSQDSTPLLNQKSK